MEFKAAAIKDNEFTTANTARHDKAALPDLPGFKANKQRERRQLHRISRSYRIFHSVLIRAKRNRLLQPGAQPLRLPLP